MVINRISKKISECKFSWKKTRGKTTAEKGRQQQEGLFVAAECRRMENDSKKQ